MNWSIVRTELLDPRIGWTPRWYAGYRVLLGLYLLVHFIHLLPWSVELFSSQGVLPDASASPLTGLFPNVLALWDSPNFVRGFIGVACGLAGMLCVGWWDRVAAVGLWYVWTCLLGRNVLILNPGIPYVGWLLVAHAFVPSVRRASTDTWRMPSVVYASAWILLAVGYTYSGLTKFVSPSWLDGTAMARVLDNPLARPTFIREALRSLPDTLLKMMTWGALFAEVMFAPMALSRRLRPFLWAGMVVMHLSLIVLIDFADLTLGMLLVHALTFNPAWLRSSDRVEADSRPTMTTMPEMIYYDGDCGLCHHTVTYVLKHDPEGEHFEFSPLGSQHFQEHVPAQTRANLPESVTVLRSDGQVLCKSTAVIYILKTLGGSQALMGKLLAIVPRPLRNLGYDGVASVRHLLFKKPDDACPMMPPELRSRFHF